MMHPRIVVAAVVIAVSGCGVSESRLSEPDQGTNTGGLSYEGFVAKYVVREPGTGVYLADGDTPFFSEKQLREFYELNVREGQLIVNRVGSADDKWDATRKLNLTYCVSGTFGADKSAVVQAMAQAGGDWAAAANIKFVYVSAQDGNCTTSNNSVLFDVRPINVNGSYLARSFFPSTARSGREVLIDSSAYGQGISLRGLLRHELGHVLGFRHEHTRPEAGTCFEDNNWRALTTYDSGSVMHYPQCNGTNDWQLPLTALDIQGAQALYGAAGSTPPPPPPTTPPTTGTTVERFSASLPQGQSKQYGPFAVKPGSTFRATLSGTGDGDLYVRMGAAPTASKFDCRPYLDGSAEECVLTVPSTATAAYVTVTGYSAAQVALEVEYVKGTVAPAPTTGTPHRASSSGTLSQGQQKAYGPVPVLGGTTLVVTMTGSGDPDLYVRFGADATVTLFDCRPYLSGPNEECRLTVPATQSEAFLMVDGYTAASFTLDVQYVSP